MNSARPNLIYILADDMGYGDVSCLNPNSRIRTGHLDRLAAQGMRFQDAHASSAVCTPSRYSILTGRYNWRSWLKEGVTWGYDRPVIEKGRLTVASLLKAYGYKTACIGKWHLGWHWALQTENEKQIDYTQPIEEGPIAKGFDYFFGISASLDIPPYVYVENDTPTAVPDEIIPERVGKAFWREGPIAPDFKHADVLPTFTQKALNYISKQADAGNPFFLYFPLPAPHTPILPTLRFIGQSNTNEYGDFCLMVDDLVGQIMQRLEDHHIAEDTILIFTSDNGCSPMVDFNELSAYGHHPSYIFRGHKADIYEGGHRIPLIIRWPKSIPAGSTCQETVCLVDLMATCAEILGEKLPPNTGEDSISNLPVWTGKKIKIPLRDGTVHSSIDGSLAIRQGRWKLEMCPGSGGWSAPRPGPECDGLPPRQLYDLQTDIAETQNIIDEHPEVVNRLENLLNDYIRRGRSTAGAAQKNTGGQTWEHLWWLHKP